MSNSRGDFAVGVLPAFEEYQRHIASDAPPWVVAYFKTRGEADIWLEGHPQPPDGTHVLVGDEYYRVIYLRDMDSRRLLRDHVLERYIDSAMQEGVPAPVAAFATSADAEKWLASQSDPPGRAFISVAGEHCLAVHHSNIKHRAIYPVSIVKRWRGEG